jgi:hypothetical protein
MNRLILASITLLALACNRSAGPSDTLSAAAENAKKLAQNAASVAAPKPVEPKDLITDDKIGRYIIYQKEMSSVTGLVMGAAVGAFTKSGGNQKGFEKELSGDERTKKIGEVSAAALAKSGLTQMEVSQLAQIITPYTTGVTIGDAEMKKKAREEFTTKFGPAALAVMEKRLSELEKLQDEMLGAAFGKKK